MASERHLLLVIEYRQGKPLKEPVHAEEVGHDTYRLLYSPGLVQGVAAGDIVRMIDGDGKFEVIRRGGNLAIQVFSKEPVAPFRIELAEKVGQLGGSLDGAIERGLAFTVPVSAGFRAVEAVFDAWVAEHPGWEWYFGNVYDPVDGVTPLGWWNEACISRSRGNQPT